MNALMYICMYVCMYLCIYDYYVSMHVRIYIMYHIVNTACIYILSVVCIEKIFELLQPFRVHWSPWLSPWNC